MALSEREQYQLVNEVGYEAFQLVVKRMEALGPASFEEVFSAVVGASAVCLANAVRPAVEASKQRAATADALVASAMKQVRELLESVVNSNA